MRNVKKNTAHRGVFSSSVRAGAWMSMLSGVVACMLTVCSHADADSIVAWGSDSSGQVSNAPTGTDFTAIAGGVTTGYALTSDGSIVAWGGDTFGEVSGAPAGNGFTAVAGGGYTGYALTSDGSIVAWGNDDSGKVSNAPAGTGYSAIAGSGFTGFALAPVPVPTPAALPAGLAILGLLGVRRRRGVTFRG